MISHRWSLDPDEAPNHSGVVDGIGVGVFVESGDLELHDVLITECGGTGMVLRTAASKVEAVRCSVINNAGSGVHLSAGSVVLQDGCVVQGNAECGIAAMGADTVATLDQGCVVSHNCRHGILLQRGAVVRVAGASRISGNEGSGVNADGPGTSFTLEEASVISKNGRHGMRLYEGALGTVKTESRIEENYGNGVVASDMGTKLCVKKGSLVCRNKGSGMQLYEGSGLLHPIPNPNSNQHAALRGAGLGTMRSVTVIDTGTD